jgi:hypothetical protein
LNFQTETNSWRDLRMRPGVLRNNPGEKTKLGWPEFVSIMKSANKFDDQESLPVPDNHILAIVKNPEEAKVIVETLNESGFSPDDIGLLTGETDAGKLDAATGKKGRDEVRQILKTYGARFITFFGRFVTEVLEA